MKQFLLVGNPATRLLVGKFLNKANPTIALFIVPLLFFVFMLFRLTELHFFYQGWYDPVYAFLMNGLTFALGSNDIGHTDHPGTPLQLICALLIKLIALLKGIPSESLARDVIRNPESYLHIIAIFLIVVNCFFLWLLGNFAFKKIDNYAIAVALQLIPLLSFDLVKYLPIVACESVIIFSSFAIAACLILYDGNSKNRKLLLIAIAFFSALSVSTKVSSVSIIIIPFFFMKGLKPKAAYLLFTMLFIFVFISPVLNKVGNFTHFIQGIVTHSGPYGSGNESLIDWNIFFQSFIKVIFKDIVFTFHLILLFAGWFFITKLKVKRSLLQLYIGITLATLFQVIIVSRHYSFHYLIPLFSLAMPLHGYFWLSLFREKIVSWPSRTTSLAVILLVTAVFIKLIVENDFQKGIVTPVEQTSKLIQKEFKAPFIILTDANNGGAFIDPALQFGLAYSGSSVRSTYTKIVDTYYRGNYRWNQREGFFDWNSSYLPAEIFSKYEELYFYERNFNNEAPMSQMGRMINHAGLAGYVKLKKVYENKLSHEFIALALIDTFSVRKNKMPVLKIETNMENISFSDNKILSNDNKFIFAGGELVSGMCAHSGKLSVMLTPSSPYGLNIAVPTSLGSTFKAEIWQRNRAGIQPFIVASSKGDGLFYKSSLANITKSDGWSKSELVFTIPDNYPENEVNFYIWNPIKDSIWVDDFSITIFP